MVAAALAICLLRAPLGAHEEPSRTGVELDKARAAKKQADEDKARTYREAHLLYKKCGREYRPFCLRSSQMMMRNAEARYKYRESREFFNIGALEAAAAAGKAVAACGGAGCVKGVD
jgi:hypothetical protein